MKGDNWMLERKKQIAIGMAINKKEWAKAISLLKEEGYSLNQIAIMLSKFGLSKEDVEYYAT